MRASSSSAVAEVYRSGSGAWSRNIWLNPRGSGVPVCGRCGQPGRPARGCRPWNGYVAGYQAGTEHCSDATRRFAFQSSAGHTVDAVRALLGVFRRHPDWTIAAVIVALALPYAIAGPHFLADDFVWLRNAQFDGWWHAGGTRLSSRPGAFVVTAFSFGAI